jgi:hypothetical protein
VKYLEAKADFEFIRKFKADVEALWQIESGARANIQPSGAMPRKTWESIVRSEAREAGGYDESRQQVSKALLRAVRIGHEIGVPLDLISYPAPAVGGPVVRVNLFQAILEDDSHGGVGLTRIRDALDQTVGGCEERVERERRYLRNPLNWVKEALVFVLRIPFLLVKATGFDVAKVEGELWAKLFKLLYLLALIYVALRLGIAKAGIVDFLKSLFAK